MIDIDLLSLSQSLSTAINSGLMAREHASAIWKEQLKVAGIDVTKKAAPSEDKKPAEKTEVKN